MEQFNFTNPINPEYLNSVVISEIDLKTCSNELLIDLAAAKKNKSDEIKEEYETISAEIQSRAIAFQEDRHIKFSEWFGNNQTVANITVAQSFEILNLSELKKLLGAELVETKLKTSVEVKVDTDKTLKKAIIALITKDYMSGMTIEQVIENAGWCAGDLKNKALLLKKLKGDYKADKKTVSTVLNVDAESLDIDEELYFIYQIKNWELIRAFFDTTNLEEVRNAVARYVAVDETLKIGIKQIG